MSSPSKYVRAKLRLLRSPSKTYKTRLGNSHAKRSSNAPYGLRRITAKLKPRNEAERSISPLRRVARRLKARLSERRDGYGADSLEETEQNYYSRKRNPDPVEYHRKNGDRENENARRKPPDSKSMGPDKILHAFEDCVVYMDRLNEATETLSNLVANSDLNLINDKDRNRLKGFSDCFRAGFANVNQPTRMDVLTSGYRKCRDALDIDAQSARDHRFYVGQMTDILKDYLNAVSDEFVHVEKKSQAINDKNYEVYPMTDDKINELYFRDSLDGSLIDSPNYDSDNTSTELKTDQDVPNLGPIQWITSVPPDVFPDLDSFPSGDPKKPERKGDSEKKKVVNGFSSFEGVNCYAVDYKDLSPSSDDDDLGFNTLTSQACQR